MSRGINKFIGIGRLGRDPEVRRTQDGGAVTNFSIAISENWKDKQGQPQERTEWVNVVCFGRLAEIAREYLRKSSRVYIEGKLQTDTYEQDGVKKYSTKINARELQMLDSKNTQSGAERTQSGAQGGYDDDIPPF